VIPDAQFRNGRCVDRRDEVDGIRVRDIDDVLIRTDAVERRHLEARDVLILHLQSPARMRESNDSAL
jgi:hypothetical protein